MGYLHAELEDYFDSLNKRVESYDVLKFRITKMVITAHHKECVKKYFNISKLTQAGPLMVTAMHFAAIYGDLSLLRLLIMRNGDNDSSINVNPNVLIHNYYNTNYVFGLITPLRLAMLFKHHHVVEYLRSIGGRPGQFLVATLRYYTIGSSFAIRGAPGFPRLNSEDSHWTNDDGTQILYIDYFMDGQRVYPGILFQYGHDPCDREPDCTIYSKPLSQVLSELGISY